MPKPVPVRDTGSQPGREKLQEIARSHGITEMLLSSPLPLLLSFSLLHSPACWHHHSSAPAGPALGPAPACQHARTSASSVSAAPSSTAQEGRAAAPGSPWSLAHPRAACPWPCSGGSGALPAARNPSAPHRDAPGHAAGTPLLWVQQTRGPGVGLSTELKHMSYSDMYEMQLTAEFSAQERSPETLFPF